MKQESLSSKYFFCQKTPPNLQVGSIRNTTPLLSPLNLSESRIFLTPWFLWTVFRSRFVGQHDKSRGMRCSKTQYIEDAVSIDHDLDDEVLQKIGCDVRVDSQQISVHGFRFPRFATLRNRYNVIDAMLV